MEEPQLIPNPADKELCIRMPGDQKHWIVSIFSLQGAPVARLENEKCNSFHLDVGRVPAGTYVCRMISPRCAMFSTKLVVIH